MRQFNPRSLYAYDMFQPTHPHGVRLDELLPFLMQARFNPRTRTGCDALSKRQDSGVNVSTHAPARGATTPDVECQATIWFQPTHPHGVRPISALRVSCLLIVSTHAPARGATLARASAISASKFQPTHPHGVRRQRRFTLFDFFGFQPTHPHGVRQRLLY